MNLEELKNKNEMLFEAVRILKENDFKEINMDNIDDKQDYLTFNDISRMLSVRLEPKNTEELLNASGLKTYWNKISLPANNEKTAYMIKTKEVEVFEDEDEEDNEDAKKIEETSYTISILYHKSVLKDLNKFLDQNESFQAMKDDIIKENNKTKNEIIKKFRETYKDSVYIDIISSGFNTSKDFVINISIFNIKDNKVVEKFNLFVNDNLNESKIRRYTTPNEITGMSQYDYLDIKLPLMAEPNEDNFISNFFSRKNVLKFLYKSTANKNIVIFNEYQLDFIQKMFKEEGLEQYSVYNVAKGLVFINELFDWNEAPYSMKTKDLIEKYNIKKEKHGFFTKGHNILEIINKILK